MGEPGLLKSEIPGCLILTMQFIVEQFVFIYCRYERKTHQDLQIGSSDANEQLSEKTIDDHKYNYHAARLFYGLLMENTRLNQSR